MATVREETFRLLRLLGLTTIFGNPGSTELPFLRDYPDDFRYVLGLQEASVLGMADGYAQASGQAALVNLHTSPGVGNAMGNIVTAFYNHSPLIITAGQQTRAMMALEPLLFARDAVELPKPYVKWSYEPARAQDVPAAIVRAYHMATQQPRGPVFLSIPMDDWDVEVEPLALHEVAWRIAPDPIALQEVARQLQDSQKLAMVVGADADRDGAWQQMIELAERTNAAVWRAPLSARVGFPDTHPLFQGDLPPAAKLLAEKLASYDTVLVVGGPVFHYYPHVPGPIVKEGTNVIHISNDPDEAARIQVGRSVVGHIALTIEQLLSQLPHTERAKPEPRRAPEVPEARAPPLSNLPHAYPWTASARGHRRARRIPLHRRHPAPLRQSQPPWQLLHDRQRGTRLRHASRRRRQAGPARSIGGLRGRRWLQHVLDPVPVDRRATATAGPLRHPAQRNVRHPQSLCPFRTGWRKDSRPGPAWSRYFADRPWLWL
ncbi:hypothetical protein KDH_24740 [Dictyobacter sp. S3.2.2.5]|uniref:Benzoylformate decarboxylase n=1 Tax=Dictyobacter halimunensis TaxID=3026934 RepID=A0ABQ6FQQ4_9CHLR|nr:hypothetical protein KDH_24740 [Dictyobacter sp. S3.2.2.5]